MQSIYKYSFGFIYLSIKILYYSHFYYIIYIFNLSLFKS